MTDDLKVEVESTLLKRLEMARNQSAAVALVPGEVGEHLGRIDWTNDEKPHLLHWLAKTFSPSDDSIDHSSPGKGPEFKGCLRVGVLMIDLYANTNLAGDTTYFIIKN